MGMGIIATGKWEGMEGSESEISNVELQMCSEFCYRNHDSACVK